MKPKIVYTSKHTPHKAINPQAPCIGQLVGMSEAGHILVRHGANQPKAARVVARLSEDELVKGVQTGAEVLLIFDGNDPEKPVITDFVAPATEQPLRVIDMGTADASHPLTAEVDGRQVTIQAKDRITLRCGKGSITLKRDGKIVVRGTQIISRASGANKIKGASVSIN